MNKDCRFKNYDNNRDMHTKMAEDNSQVKHETLLFSSYALDNNK